MTDMTQAPTPGPLSVGQEETIAFNLCAVHGFEPDFVKTQRDFALAVIREYEVVCRPRLAPTAPVEASGSERDHRFVPGVMRCAKCNFVVVRRVFSAIDGTVGDGDNKTEPCPNGCGPLWPMTWEQNSRDMEERCEAAVLEAANLRAQLALRPQPSEETREAQRLAVVRGLRRWLEWDFEGSDDQYEAGAHHILNAMFDDRLVAIPLMLPDQEAYLAEIMKQKPVDLSAVVGGPRTHPFPPPAPVASLEALRPQPSGETREGESVAIMRPFWVSWWGESGTFELHRPWWISGERDDGKQSICAAVLAQDEFTARLSVQWAHDDKDAVIEWRFSEEKPKGWSPFGDRFRQADWMIWPENAALLAAPADGGEG